MEEWPVLPFEEWRATRDTLHMYTQVVGKLRLALSPFEPQWANVPLYLTARGLTTSPVPYSGRTFDAEFDFLGHELVVRTSDGHSERVPLGPRPVADFYHDVMTALGRVDMDVTISATPSEVADPIPFAEDRTHQAYDPEQVTRFFHLLSRVDVVFKEHRARFLGKTPPVHFFWGSFDLAVTRFSGRPVTPPAGADVITRYGGDAEQICAGFWPGHDKFPHAAFFGYAYPKPDGIESSPLRPEAAHWDDNLGEFVLPYDAVRSASEPRRALLDFLETAYEAGAARLGWDSELIHGQRP